MPEFESQEGGARCPSTQVNCCEKRMSRKVRGHFPHVAVKLPRRQFRAHRTVGLKD